MAFTPFSNGTYNTSAPTLSNGQIASLQLDVNGNLKTVTAGSGGVSQQDLEELAGVQLGAPSAYGTAPATSVTPTLVQKATPINSTGVGGSPYMITLPSNVTKGNLILITAIWDGNDSLTLPTASDSPNGSYTALGSFASNTGGPGGSLTSLIALGVIATTSASLSVHVTMNGRGTIQAFEYSNLKLAVDGTPASIGQTTSSTTITTPSITTTNATDMLFCLFGSVTNATTVVAGSGYTLRDHDNSTGFASYALEDQIVSATGSYTGGYTNITGSQFASALTFALKINEPNSNSIPVNAFITNTPTVEITDGTNVLGTSSHPVRVDPTGTTIQPTKVIDSAGTNALAVDSSGAASSNVTKLGGTAIDTNSGNKSAGTQRVVIATDQPNLTTALNVQDASDGPVTAGTAASKSSLAALVAATSAPTPTNGQQIALQGDTSGNLRISPYGATGSFQSKKATGTGVATATLTVPASTKWILKGGTALITVANSGSARTCFVQIADASANTIVSVGTSTGIAAPINTFTAYAFGPGLPYGYLTTASAGSGIVGGNTAIPMPELLLGPGFTISFVISSGVVGDTTQIVANVMVIPD